MNSKVATITSRIQDFSLTQTPRLLLYPLITIVQLAASALGGMGFVYNNSPPLLLTGTVLWLV